MRVGRSEMSHFTTKLTSQDTRPRYLLRASDKTATYRDSSTRVFGIHQSHVFCDFKIKRVQLLGESVGVHGSTDREISRFHCMCWESLNEALFHKSQQHNKLRYVEAFAEPKTAKHKEFTAHVGNQVNIILRQTNHDNVYHLLHMSNMYGKLNRLISRVHSMRVGRSEMSHFTTKLTSQTLAYDIYWGRVTKPRHIGTPLLGCLGSTKCHVFCDFKIKRVQLLGGICRGAWR